MIKRFYTPLMLLIVIAVMAIIISVGEGIDAYYRSRLLDMVHGTAWRPYVTRALVPFVANLASAATALLFGRFPHSEYLFVTLAMAASLIGFQSGLRRLFRATYMAGDAAIRVTALAALAALPLTFGPFSRQIYDFTTLWMFALTLALMYQQRWSLYLAWFAVATVNKETSVLLALVFLFHFIQRKRMPLARIASLLAAQALIFIAIRGLIAYIFRDNPGGVVEINWENHNQQVLLDPRMMSKRLFLLIAVAAFGAWHWREKSSFLRDAFIVLAPVLLIMGVTVGQVDEIRAYYEIYPLVVVMAADSFCRLTGTFVEART